jgi:hypothetical protein
MAPPFSHLRCEQRRVTCVDGSIGDFAVFKAPTQNLGHRAPGLALWLFLAEPRRCAWGRAGLSLRASRPPRGILRRYRRLAYFHPLLSAFAESVVRKWPNDSVFCFVIVLWIARRHEQLGLEFQAGAISLFRQTGDQSHLHQIEQGLAIP